MPTKLIDSGDVGWPKQSITCQLRLLGGSGRNGNGMTSDVDATTQRVVVLTEEARVPKLMIHSGGSVKSGAYYRGGNSFPICPIEPHAGALTTAGRAVIPLESASRFTTQRITSRCTEQLKQALETKKMFLDELAVRSLINEGRLDWGGELRRDSLLLTLGNRLQSMAHRPPAVVDLTDQDQIDAIYGETLVGWHSFTLRRGELALFHADHSVALPRSVGGFIGGLSHMARLGLTVHLDTPIVDAGFHGVLTIEMFNAGPSDVILRPGMPVAKVLLYRVGDGALVEPYHHVFYGNEEHLGSKYASEFFSAPATEG
ncbi:MAG: dCTP deaminase [Pseudonocardiaceae bacterium]